MTSKSDYQERKKAKGLFKRLKVGLTSWEDLSDDDIRLLRKYYGWLFRED